MRRRRLRLRCILTQLGSAVALDVQAVVVGCASELVIEFAEEVHELLGRLGETVNFDLVVKLLDASFGRLLVPIVPPTDFKMNLIRLDFK